MRNQKNKKKKMNNNNNEIPIKRKPLIYTRAQGVVPENRKIAFKLGKTK